MIRFFKSPQPAMMIIIPVIILAFWIRSVFHPLVISDVSGLPIWDGISSFLRTMPSWFNFTLLFIILSIEAIYLNLMINKHEVLYKNTYIPALLFAFFISCSPSLMQFHPVHLVNLILIRVFDRTFSLFKNEVPVTALFDSGFLSGVAALIFFPAVVILPIIMIALGILRPFRIKEWMIMLIGFFLPYYFLSVYLFCYDSIFTFWRSYIGSFNNFHPHIIYEKNTRFLFIVFYLGLLLLLSLLKLRVNFRKNVIRTRIYQQVFFIFLLIGSGGLFFLKEQGIIDFTFLLLPLTVFCSYYFVSAKKRLWLYEYGFWLLVAIVVWNNINR